MSKFSRLLIVGGGNLERDLAGSWLTKTPIANYLQEISQYFDSCTWMAQLYEGSPILTGKISSESIKVVPFKGGLNTPINWIKLISLVQSNSYIILYLPAILTLVPTLPIIKRRSLRLVIYLGNDYEKTLNEYSNKWLGWSTLYRIGHEYPMKVADGVIVRGRYLARLARCFNENIIETVPLAHFNYSNDSNQLITENSIIGRILYLGKVLWSKGLGDLVKAFQLLREKHSSHLFSLEVVGDGVDSEEIEEQTKKLGLEEFVTFHGWIESEEKLSQFFNEADVLVVPTSSYPEGVPRVIDEALIRGVPVVATRVGGIEEEFVNQEVMLVDAGNPVQLATAIEGILMDSEVRDRYLAGAKLRASHWESYRSAAAQHANFLLGTSDDA